MAFDLNGAWATGADQCKQVFVKKGDKISFAQFSEEFGGGFVDGLNGGEPMVPECRNGFSNLAVAKTRILQGSHIEVTGLSKGEHRFECCIHPWMRVKVQVK